MFGRTCKMIACAVILFSLVSTALVAMQWGSGRRGRGNRSGSDYRAGVPLWEIDKNFEQDVFTFARVQYSDGYGGGYGYRRGGKWATDFPDSDLNFSLRLQQLTSLKVNPQPVVLQLTDPTLFDYPFLYMIEPGDLTFGEEEVVSLRRYLTNGGFMMVDDFWGQGEWFNFYREIKRVFPEREPKEVPLEHEIFQCVYQLDEKPQVPSIHAFYGGRSYEGRYDSDTSHANYTAISDDEGASWCSSVTTPTWEMAGNAKVRIMNILRSTQSKSRTP